MQARPVAHHLVVQRARVALGGMLLHLAAGVGDPRFAQRVGQQKLRRLAGVAVGAVHALKHAHHAAGIQARPHHGVEAHPVRLLLPAPAVAQLVGLGRRLHAGHRRHARIAAAHGADHDGGHHRRQGGQGLGPLHLNAPGEVALAQVGELVADDAGVLVDILGVQHEAEIDADDAARRGEGVDLVVVDEDGLQHRLAQVAVLGELRHLLFHVVLEDGVIDGGQRRPHLLDEVLADAALRLRRDQAGGGVPQGRQVVAALAMRHPRQEEAGKQAGHEGAEPRAVHGPQYNLLACGTVLGAGSVSSRR